MHDSLMIYFDGEKYAGLILAGVGAGAIVAAVLIARVADLRPFALTLGILALAEIALGVGLYLCTGPQVARLVDQLNADTPAFRSAEGARMTRVQRTFVIVEYVEVAVIVLAAFVALTQKGNPVIAGVALGLLINASVLLAFDVIAERRGATYLNAVAVG